MSTTETPEASIKEHYFDARGMPIDYLSERDPGVLSPQAERNLLKRIAEGDPLSKEHFILANTGLLRSAYYRLIREGKIPKHTPLDDMMQIGYLALDRSLKKFDTSRGIKFSTYATKWIEQFMTRQGPDQTGPIHIPHERLVEVRRFEASKSRLTDELGRNPNDNELAEAMAATINVVATARSIQETTGEPFSLDFIYSDGEGGLVELHDRIFYDFDFTENAHRLLSTDELWRCLRLLPEDERLMIEHRFGLKGREELTFEEIGKKFGLKRETTRKKIGEILLKIQEGISSHINTDKATDSVLEVQDDRIE